MDGRGGVAAERPAMSEADIARLVHAFYARVRRDDLIGPIFNGAVGDWDEHLAKLCDFWSSMMLKTGRYDGRPLRPHLLLPIEAAHFDRWLDLFERTAAEELPTAVARAFIDRARGIADSFELATASARGRIATPRHGLRA